MLITLRYLTTWVNACWGIGQLLALAVLRGLLSRTDDWGWRIPYALQVRKSRASFGAELTGLVDVARPSCPCRLLCA